jgi:hypothetical protein
VGEGAEVERLGEDADAGSTPVVMSDKLGNKYKCFLPPVGTEEGAGGEEGEEVRAANYA